MTDQSSTSSHDANASLFPYRLYEMLEECEKQGKSHIVSWLPDGKAFKVHQVPEFVATILPAYFRQSKYKSYQRQLNLWGFERVTTNGPEKGAYYHASFLKGHPAPCKLLTRQKGNKSATSPLHTSSKLTKPKSPNTHKNILAKPPKDDQKESSFTSKEIPVRSQHTDLALGCVLEDFSIEDALPIPGAYNEARDNFQPTAEPKLFFEGCEFFPLEEARYDELESIILRAGTDLLDYRKSQNDAAHNAERGLGFRGMATAHLCKV